MNRNAAIRLLAVAYVAGCLLPGEPSAGERIEFRFEFPDPFRVPLAGSAVPAITVLADGRILENPRYRLESLDTAVVRVDADGRRLQGIGRGPASVRVVYRTAMGTPDSVFSVQVVVSRVSVTLSSLSFNQLGRRRQLGAAALDAQFDVVSNVPFTWSSLDTAVAVVNDTGLVTAVYEGATTITVEADGVVDSSHVTVTQVAGAVLVTPELDTLRAIGRSIQLSALAFDSGNTVLDYARPEWTSTAPQVVSVDDTGRATAVGAGTARIVARVGAARDTATVVVAQVVRLILVSPDVDTLTALADTVRVVAEAFDSNGVRIPTPAITWATGDAAIATVSTTGLVTAAGNGVVLITAANGSQSAGTIVLVSQDIMAAGVSPDNVGLTARGDTLRLSAIALDKNGFAVTGAAFTWRSTNGFVATVDSTGLVRAREDGVAQIVATADRGGRADTAAVSVTGAPPLPGILLIRTTTTGIQPDADGYSVMVDGNSTAIGANDSVAISIVAGAHVVSLAGIAVNCTAVGDVVRSVNVPSADTVRVDFAVTCATPAILRVRTSTTGPNPDPDGYLVVVDEYCDYYYYGCFYSWTVPVGVNDSVTWTPAVPGTRTVGLSGLTQNCTVVGPNPVSVTLTPGLTTQVMFSVTCMQAGSVRVTTVTTGADLDLDGYGVSVSGPGGAYSPIGVNASHTIDQLLPGAYTVQLGSLAGNCRIDGLAIQAVTVVGGATVDVAFAVICEPLAVIRVAVATTGVAPDADGYVVTVASPGDSRNAALASNGTVLVDRLLQATYTVHLGGVSSNCTVTSPNGLMVSVAWGDTADAVFAVACVPPTVIRVTVATTGVDPDPDGYVVTAAGAGRSRSGAVASTGAVAIDSLIEGTYAVSLGSSAVNCAVTGPGQISVFVAAGDTAHAAFDVVCTAAELLAVAMPVNGNTDIYLVKANGTGPTRLTTHPLPDLTPAWSASSGKIAFVSYRDGNAEIYVMSPDGSGQLRLTNDQSGDYNPAWSPDGLKIAFWSDRDGNPEIYVMNADGSSPVRVTVNQVSDLDPAWSLDGLSIAFASSRDYGLDIYRMKADGSGVTRLTFGGYNRSPDWSPDGTKLVYSNTYCDYYSYNCIGSLVVMNADGAAADSLPTAVGYEPVWSPDGRWIAFTGVDYYGVHAARGDGTGLVPIVGAAYQPAWRR